MYMCIYIYIYISAAAHDSLNDTTFHTRGSRPFNSSLCVDRLMIINDSLARNPVITHWREERFHMLPTDLASA